jgi:hypothetical protein
MLPRHRSTSSSTGFTALVAAGFLLVLTSAPSPARAASLSRQPYAFIKSPTMVARVDTATGQVSTVAINGDGGWKPLGSAPTADGSSNHLGRYGLLRLPPIGAGGRPGRSSMLEPVLLFDHATGRAWIAEMTQSSAWREIGADAQAAVPDEDSVTSAASSQGSTGKPVDAGLQVLSKQKLEAVGGMTKEDVDVFIQAIQKPGIDTDVKVWATLQLGAADPDLSVPPLLEALGSDEPRVVAAAVQALAQTGVPSVVPHILKLEDHPDPAVRASVAAAVKRVD